MNYLPGGDPAQPVRRYRRRRTVPPHPSYSPSTAGTSPRSKHADDPMRHQPGQLERRIHSALRHLRRWGGHCGHAGDGTVTADTPIAGIGQVVPHGDNDPQPGGRKQLRVPESHRPLPPWLRKRGRRQHHTAARQSPALVPAQARSLKQAGAWPSIDTRPATGWLLDVARDECPADRPAPIPLIPAP